LGVQRRAFLASLAATLTSAAERLPANRNVKWAVSAGLWSHYPASPITDILDVMRDTGFIGVRLTGFPGILKTYNLTTGQLAREVSKRNLNVVTISFGGPVNDSTQHAKVVENAKEAMRFLQDFGAKHLVVFPPGRMKPGRDVETGFRSMCTGFNRIGEAANAMGFQAALHNHLDDMVQGPEEVDRCMEMTDPKLFHFAPDTAHLHLGGSDVVRTFEKYKVHGLQRCALDHSRSGPGAAQRQGTPEGLIGGEIFREHLRPGRLGDRFSRVPSHSQADRIQRLDLRGPGPHAQRAACELRALRTIRSRAFGADICLIDEYS
jgi:sugar phosphate isomerase/epimerase